MRVAPARRDPPRVRDGMSLEHHDPPTACDVVVIGGGIAGLAAAHHVAELAATRPPSGPLVLLEAGTRLGGTIATERVGGYVIESGADSILTEKPWGLALCRRLGLEDRMIRTRDSERRTFIVHGGRLHPLPEGFMLLAPTSLLPLVRSRLFSWPGKLRMACDLVLPRGRRAGEDESLASFVGRRLGREALERAAQPLVGGIYTADASRLSLAATMPRFLEMEERHRSLIVGMRRQARAAAGASGARWTLFASFVDGMQTLVDALAARLPEGTVRLGARVTALAPVTGRGWRIELAGGAELRAARIVVATPSYVAADLLRPLDPSLAGALAAITYASSAIVTLAYDRADVPHPLDGFGFVVPAIERRRLIAGSFSSVKYAGRAPAGKVLLRVFCGGALATDVLSRPDDELTAIAREELATLLGVRAAPELVRVHRHPRAMPQYDVGHLERVRALEAAVARHPGLALAGNAYRGVGVPDCIHGGERAAAALLGLPADGGGVPPKV
jgi:protoporphyrinogen/coproporphyrinogen III oxidase